MLSWRLVQIIQRAKPEQQQNGRMWDPKMKKVFVRPRLSWHENLDNCACRDQRHSAANDVDTLESVNQHHDSRSQHDAHTRSFTCEEHGKKNSDQTDHRKSQTPTRWKILVLDAQSAPVRKSAHHDKPTTVVPPQSANDDSFFFFFFCDQDEVRFNWTHGVKNM